MWVKKYCFDFEAFFVPYNMYVRKNYERTIIGSYGYLLAHKMTDGYLKQFSSYRLKDIPTRKGQGQGQIKKRF